MKLNLIFLVCIFALNACSIQIQQKSQSGASVQGQQKSQFDASILSETGRKSYEKLLNAGIFSIGKVGEGGDTSEEELALHLLSKEKQAIEALVTLADQATSEGALYALLGLRLKDTNLFKSAVEKYKSLPEPPERNDAIVKEIKIPKGYVQTQSGCKIGAEERLKIVAQIEAGVFDETFKLSEDEAANSK
ncbi:MAG: hypothetical protein JWN60_3366 [Acidobacteria bacterium]|jgi:hypothetical protein|nr:hypothetical protein [Acidobacteriota bacterium]